MLCYPSKHANPGDTRRDRISVLHRRIKEYGKVIKRRKGEYDDVMEMDSHYFICDVEPELGSRNLDDYEKEYNYQIVWMSLPEAIE